MHNHFLRGVFLERVMSHLKPKVILEVGAADGHHTALLSQDGRKVVVVSDGKKEESLVKGEESVNWISGVSQNVLPTLCPTIKPDLVILDSDHNYWTLKQELDACYPHLPHECAIAIHDTITFWGSNGRQHTYGTGDPYPADKIVGTKKLYGQAVTEFLSQHPDMLLVLASPLYHGALVLGRGEWIQHYAEAEG